MALCILAIVIKFFAVMAPLLSVCIAYTVFKFNHDVHAKQTINLFVQRCNDATKDGGLSATKESLGTVITSCLKACEYIERHKQPLAWMYTKKCKQNYRLELKNYLWNLLPFYVWEEIIFRRKLEELRTTEHGITELSDLLNVQYNDLSISLCEQIKKHGGPPVSP